MNIKKIILFIAICLLPTYLLAQTTQEGKKAITGVVLDDQNESMPGVNVVVKGLNTGVVTDIDGNYSILVSNDDILVFSFIGYTTQEIAVGNKTKIDVALRGDTELIDEIVVTGYGGRQRRSKLTNSIATVKNETLKSGLYSNPAQALSGAVAGLKVIQSSGSPSAAPTIVLRGGTNLDGTGSPLIMIDGQVRDNLNDINPEDIESLEVLKDAGATALYGARANNGVILVTTKTGKSGKSSISFKARVGINYLNNPYEMMNGGDYLYWMRSAVKNASQIWQNQKGDWQGYTNMSSLDGVQPYGVGNLYWDPNNPTIALDGNKDARAVWSPMILDDTNRFLLSEGWQTMKDPITGETIIYTEFDYAKAAFKNPSITQDYNIALSGGNDKGHYYAGIGYYDAEGIPIKTYYKRITAIFNGDYKIKPWLTSYTTFNFANTNKKESANIGYGDYFGRMLSAPPTMRGYNADGEELLGRSATDGNPKKNIDKFIRDLNTDKFTLGQSFQFDLFNGFYVKASALWAYDENFNETFDKDYLSAPGIWSRTRSTAASFERKKRQTYNIIANYDFLIQKNHAFSTLLGFEYFDDYLKGFNASGSGAPTDDFQDLGLTSSDKNKRNIDSWHIRQRIMSFMGRINYDYKEKYLASVTFRRDGYSTLIDNRWGLFPGVSLGWVFGKENFMQKMTDIISFAKLRSSYGVNGNVSGVGAYELQGAYGTANYDGTVGYKLTQIPNQSLQWEKSNTFEIGLDLGWLNNAINSNITYYNRTTVDKFANIPLPGSSGITSIRSNNGEINNKGLELELGFKVLNNDEWKWNINANIAYNKNKIIKLPENGLERNRQSAIQVYTGNGDERIWVGGYQEGQEPGAIYAYVAEGIYKSEEEVMSLAANRIDKTVSSTGAGKFLYGPNEWAKLTDAQKGNAYPIQAGDVIWKDVNKDGIIDTYDKVYMGNTTPKWLGGFTNVLSWKGITFSSKFDFALGHYQVDTARPFFMGCMQGSFNSIIDTRDSWSPENPNAKYPKYYWADQAGKRNYDRPSNSLFIYNASYLAIRELSLNYRLPQTLTQKIGAENAEFSITGQNLGYITNSKLYTPEQGGNTGSGYALPRTVILGVSITY